MRLRDILKLPGFKQLIDAKELSNFKGAFRKSRRMMASTARRSDRPARTKPKNWNRDKHQRRKLAKARRKQGWR